MPSDSHPTTQHRPTARAVSPVIGVVLMVAITVVLAGTIGVVVFGLTPTGDETPPIANVVIDEGDEGNVTLVHEGGDTLDLEEFTLVSDGDEVVTTSLNNSLHSGDRREVATDGEDIDGEVILRHDPSGEILARTTID